MSAVRRKNRIKMSAFDKAFQVFVHFFVTLIVLACLFPLAYIIGMSFTTEAEMMRNNYFVLIPEKPTLQAYQSIIQKSSFFSSLGLSALRVLFGIPAALLLTVPGGYILATKKLPGRKWFVLYFIITIVLNGGLIPNYLLMNQLKLLNSFWVYIVPSFGGAFSMLVVKLFVEGIPGDIMESADIDGASETTKMTLIALPLLVPTICALGLFAAVAHWNSWFDSMLYVRDANLRTVQYVIRELLISSALAETGDSMALGERVATEGIKMASVVFAVAPILCIYPFLQKYFIYGMYTGAVKG